MTVAELIKKLETMPQDAMVVNASCYEEYIVESVTYEDDFGNVDGYKEYVLLH